LLINTAIIDYTPEYTMEYYQITFQRKASKLRKPCY